ncbi:hypothetical protein ACIPSA_27825 [Streptomyces sp. NPDC086549]|uniref:hypothetical protein n=1 Tax=Streptomyces sp. NPDC086549 TaxID=3365752 RepID=UPI0037FFCAFA
MPQVVELGFGVRRLAEPETFEKQPGDPVGVPMARFDTPGRITRDLPDHSGSG